MNINLNIDITDTESEALILLAEQDLGAGAPFTASGSYLAERTAPAGGQDVIVLKDLPEFGPRVRLLYLQNLSAVPLVLYGVPSLGYSEHTPVLASPTELEAYGVALLDNPVKGYPTGNGKFEEITLMNMTAEDASYKVYIVFAPAP